jgi:site-specific recombinase XerD
MNSLPLSKAIEGFLINAAARRLSPNTVDFYINIFKKLQRFFPGDPDIGDITTGQVEQFLASLTTLSKKSLLGHHAGLSSLWRWAAKEKLTASNIIREIQQPHPEERIVSPFTEAEVKAILAAVDKSKFYKRPGKRECQHTIATAARNRALLFVLLDTGMRAAELCGLHINDVDLKARHVKVMGKGSKERLIPFSAQTGQILWRYIALRKDETVNAVLFPSARTGRELPPRELWHVVSRIGRRAGVADVHPHRFRHTFAIQYLRNKGDVYTLQAILGHTTLDMVRRYLAIAQTDIEAAHRIASPVANWRL